MRARFIRKAHKTLLKCIGTFTPDAPRERYIADSGNDSAGSRTSSASTDDDAVIGWLCGKVNFRCSGGDYVLFSKPLFFPITENVRRKLLGSMP